MPIATDSGRQWPLYTQPVTVGFADLVTAVAAAFAEVPVNAVVVGGYVNVTEVWDSTTNALIVGDAADDNRYTASTIDLKALGATLLDVTGFQYTAVTDLLVEQNETGAVATTGIFVISVAYIVVGRETEVQGVN